MTIERPALSTTLAIAVNCAASVAVPSVREPARKTLSRGNSFPACEYGFHGSAFLQLGESEIIKDDVLILLRPHEELDQVGEHRANCFKRFVRVIGKIPYLSGYSVSALDAVS